MKDNHIIEKCKQLRLRCSTKIAYRGLRGEKAGTNSKTTIFTGFKENKK